MKKSLPTTTGEQFNTNGLSEFSYLPPRKYIRIPVSCVPGFLGMVRLVGHSPRKAKIVSSIDKYLQSIKVCLKQDIT